MLYILQYFPCVLANLENMEVFHYQQILDCKQQCPDLQNGSVVLEYGSDLQFLSRNLILDEPMEDDNFRNSFQLQISNCILHLI